MEDFVFLQSPNQLAITVACYLFTLKIGPILMKYRTPFKLKKILVYYNYSQIFFNAAILFAALPVAHKVSLFCRYDDSTPAEINRMMKLYPMYVLLKFYDLFDTIFFVLRKKQEQITFLHVYHHVTILSVAWMFLKYFPATHYPGGVPLLFIFFNCFVHAVMYTYYLMSAKGKVKSLLWKKCVTILQIIQHCIMFFVTLSAFVAGSDCPYPRGLSFAGVAGFFSMVYLFCQFYYNTYIRKKQKTQMEESSKARID